MNANEREIFNAEDLVEPIRMLLSSSDLKAAYSDWCDRQRKAWGYDQDEMDKRCGFFNRFVDDLFNNKDSHE